MEILRSVLKIPVSPQSEFYSTTFFVLTSRFFFKLHAKHLYDKLFAFMNNKLILKRRHLLLCESAPEQVDVDKNKIIGQRLLA